MIDQLVDEGRKRFRRVRRWHWVIVVVTFTLAIGTISIVTEVGLIAANTIEIIDEAEGRWRTTFQQSLAHLAHYGATGSHDAWTAYQSSTESVQAIGGVRDEFLGDNPDSDSIERALGSAGLISPRSGGLRLVVPWMKRFGYLNESLEHWSRQDSLLNVVDAYAEQLRAHETSDDPQTEFAVGDVLERLSLLGAEVGGHESRFENSITRDQDQIQALARFVLFAISLMLFFGGGFVFFRAFKGLRRAREEVREGHGLIRDLMEAASEAIVIWQIGGPFVRVNEIACTMTGYEKSELYGLDPRQVLSPESQEGRPIIGGELEEDRVLRIERELARKDGTTFHALVSIRRIDDDHILAIVRDITERKRIEEDLQLFRTLIDHAGDPIQVIDPATGRFLDINEKACRSVGYTREEMLKMSVPDIDVSVKPSIFPLQPAWIPESDSYTYEGLYRRKDGTEFPVEVRLKYVSLENDYIVASVRDISAHKATEETLRQAKEEAETTSRLKGTMLRNMSHEVRTPLAGIIGFAQLLSEDDSSSHPEELRMIETSAQRLLETFNSLLDLSAIESGAMHPQMEQCDLADEIHLAVRAFEPLSSIRGLDLECRLPDDGLPAVTDRNFWIRIVNNLVGNAIKFTDSGHVHVTLQAEEGNAVLEVTDTGIGISDEFMPHVFDAFQQESAGIDREFEGNGLGLAVTRELVRLLDGSVDVESEKGAGSTFRVTIPGRFSEVQVRA